MKTSELILDVALTLFNERGESLVNSVDVAYETNISPGNLYYHFKGKGEIVEALYARFDEKLSATMAVFQDAEQHAPAGEILACLSEISKVFVEYRFISQDAIGLCERYPAIQPRFKRQLKRLHDLLLARARNLPETPMMKKFPDTPRLLADNVLNTLLHLRQTEDLLTAEPARQPSPSIEDYLYAQVLPYLETST